jgi:hypothetical protein
MHIWTVAIFRIFSPLVFVLPLSAQDPAQENDSQVVVSEGVGASPEEALRDAFRNAVRQVVGAVVDAETQVKNDELINDKVLTFSDGFIKKYDEIDGSKTQIAGLHRIRIKANVEKKSLLAKLRSSNVVMKSVDGIGLFAQTVTKLDSEKEAIAILEKQFKGFPQSCLSASVVGEPKVIEKDSENATIEIMVQLEPDLTAFRDFSRNLRSVLDKMTKDRGNFELVSNPTSNEVNHWHLKVPSEFAKNSECRWMVIPNSQTGMSLYFRKPSRVSKALPSDASVILVIGTNRNKTSDRMDFIYYRLDPALTQKMNQLSEKAGSVSLELLDGNGERMTGTKMSLHQPLFQQYTDATFFISPTFFGMLSFGRPLIHTPLMQTPFRFKLSLDELKALSDIKVEVQFED